MKSSSSDFEPRSRISGWAWPTRRLRVIGGGRMEERGPASPTGILGSQTMLEVKARTVPYWTRKTAKTNGMIFRVTVRKLHGRPSMLCVRSCPALADRRPLAATVAKGGSPGTPGDPSGTRSAAVLDLQVSALWKRCLGLSWLQCLWCARLQVQGN